MSDQLEELPSKKADLEETQRLLERLEARKDRVDPDRYERLRERYEEKIDRLEPEVETLTEKGETRKLELEDRLAHQKSRIEEAEEELEEIETLYEEGALDEETYRKDRRRLRRKKKTAGKEISQIEGELHEVRFYLQEKGDVSYRKEKVQQRLRDTADQVQRTVFRYVRSVPWGRVAVGMGAIIGLTVLGIYLWTGFESKHVRKGRRLIKAGNGTAALRALRKERKTNPKNETALLLTGEANLLRGKIREAQKAFGRAISLDKDHRQRVVETYLEYGRSWDEKGKTKKSIEALQKAVQVDSSSRERVGKVAFDHAKEHLKSEDWEKAVQFAKAGANWSDGAEGKFLEECRTQWDQYLSEGEKERAVKVMRLALQVDSEYDEALEAYREHKPDQIISYTSTRYGNREIFRMDGDGSDKTRLTNNSATDTSPAIAPDGQEVVFFSKRTGRWELFKISIDGTGLTQLTSGLPATQGAKSIEWHPDGGELAFGIKNNDVWKIYRCNPDGSGVRQLIEENTSGRTYDYVRPDYSPDGRYITMRGNVPFNGYSSEVWIADAEGTNVRQLTSSPRAARAEHPTFAFKNGALKIVHARTPDSDDRQIWTMNTDGSDAANISNNYYHENGPVGPDGTGARRTNKILFFSNRGDGQALWKMNLNGNNAQGIYYEDIDEVDWWVGIK